MHSSPSSEAPPVLPLRLGPLALHHLLELISKITVDDIRSAERCGGGGYGDVYVLTRPAIGKLALKRMRTSGTQEQVDAQIRRSTREAETWRQLDHPNILPFLDVLERSEHIYLISPFIQNGSLSDFIRRHPDADRARLIQEAAAGIAYLHRNEIIHGDIKAANILVSDDVRALLCDFGLARSQQTDTSTEMQGIGTIRWQSPELLLSGVGKTFKSDVWAFAMTICEVLSGQIPYHQYEATPVVIVKVLVHKERPAKEPAISPTGASYASLWEVAEDCWHENPDQRPEIQEARDRLILPTSPYSPLSLSPRVNEDTSADDRVVISTSPPTPSGPFITELPATCPEPEQTAQGHAGLGLGMASAGGAIRLWDAEAGSETGEPMLGHTNGVHCLAFSPDGKTLATGSSDRSLRLWDVEERNQRGGPLEGHTDGIFCLTFSQDGATVATGSVDKTIRLWDVEAGCQRGEPLEGHSAPVYCVAFSPDGSTVAFGSFE